MSGRSRLTGARWLSLPSSLLSAFPRTAQARQPLDLRAAIEAGALDALSIAAEQATTDVGIERRRLDLQQRTDLCRGVVLLAAQRDHFRDSPLYQTILLPV